MAAACALSWLGWTFLLLKKVGKGIGYWWSCEITSEDHCGLKVSVLSPLCVLLGVEFADVPSLTRGILQRFLWKAKGDGHLYVFPHRSHEYLGLDWCMPSMCWVRRRRLLNFRPHTEHNTGSAETGAARVVKPVHECCFTASSLSNTSSQDRQVTFCFLASPLCSIQREQHEKSCNSTGRQERECKIN